jgi:hypothetical protein
MTYTLQSFQANGERLEHLGQKAAFFALLVNGIVFDYFGTLEALQLAKASLERAELEDLTREVTSFDFKLAA